MTSLAAGKESRAKSGASILIRLGLVCRTRLFTRLMIVFVTVCYCFALVKYGFGRSLWADEVWVANSVTAPSLSKMFYYTWLQTSPPLFLLAVRGFVAVFGIANAVWRIIPALMGVLSAALMAVVLRRVLSRLYALAAWTLFVLSPTALLNSVSLKQYSSELAAATAVLLASLGYFRRPTLLRFWLLVATIGIALLLAYPVTFLLPGIFVCVCLSPILAASDPSISTLSWFTSFLRGLTLAVAAASEFLGEYVFFISRNVSADLRSFWEQNHQRGFITVVFYSCVQLLHLLALPGRLLTSKGVGALAGILLLAGFVLAAVKFRNGQRKWLVIQILCGTPCLLVVIASLFSWYPSTARTCLFLLPYVALIVMADVQQTSDFILQRWTRCWLTSVFDIALVGLTLAIAVTATKANYLRSLDQPPEDLNSAVSYLNEHVQPNDFLWIHPSVEEGFKFYKQVVGWKGQTAEVGHTGWPCCPRGVVALRGRGTEAAVRSDVEQRIPVGVWRKIWYFYTTRKAHWDFVGLDESQVTRNVLLERGCFETTRALFLGVGISSFDCDAPLAERRSSKP